MSHASTGNILDSRSECQAALGVLNTGKGVGGVHTEGQLPSPSASVTASAFKPDATARELMLSAVKNAAPSADSQYQGLIIEWLTGAVISAEEHAAEIVDVVTKGYEQ